MHHVANGFAAGDDRNDLMQELLLAVWKSIPSFRSGARPSTYIYRVSHNAAMTWKRTRRNYQSRIECFQAQTRTESVSPHDARESELLARLYAEIRKLTPLDRSLALLMLDGMSHREMGEIHGLSESNVGVRIHRLKLKLTNSMKGATHEL